MSISSVEVGTRRWSASQNLSVSSLQLSWEVSVAGQFSFILPSAQAALLGHSSLLGLWVYFEHETLGSGGGVITDITADFTAGTLEVAGESFGSLLRKKRTSRSFRTQAAPAGSLWLRAVSDVQIDGDLEIDEAYADEGGSLFSIEWRGDDLFDLTERLSQMSNHEWDVTIDSERRIYAEFREEIGRDQRGSVILLDGRDVVEGTIAGSSFALVNDILAVAGDTRWADADHAVVRDPDSIELYGASQATTTYDYVTRRASLYTRAKEDLELYSQPIYAASVKLSASNPQLDNIRQGDTVWLVSSDSNHIFDFRVMARAYASDDDSVTLAGNCTVSE